MFPTSPGALALVFMATTIPLLSSDDRHDCYGRPHFSAFSSKLVCMSRDVRSAATVAYRTLGDSGRSLGPYANLDWVEAVCLLEAEYMAWDSREL